MSIAWISTEPEGEDAERLAAIYERFGTPGGVGLDHVLKIHGLMPETLDQHVQFYVGIMRAKGPLTRTEREIVGVVVSKRNGCHY